MAPMMALPIAHSDKVFLPRGNLKAFLGLFRTTPWKSIDEFDGEHLGALVELGAAPLMGVFGYREGSRRGEEIIKDLKQAKLNRWHK
jgi:hypothetical protein